MSMALCGFFCQVGNDELEFNHFSMNQFSEQK